MYVPIAWFFRGIYARMIVQLSHSTTRFFFDGFSIIPALVRRVNAFSSCIDGTAKAFAEGGALHGLDLRDGVNTEGNQDEQ